MADVNFNDITNATTIEDGTGYFDKLMNTINIQIDNQYQKGRLKGTDYATVYLGLVQSAMVEAFKFELQKDAVEEGIALTKEQTSNEIDKRLNTAKQREVMDAQKDLYIRQKNAFDDNKYQKLLEAQLNYNGLVFQDATNPDVLNVALEQKVNDVFNKLTLDDPLTAMPEV